MKKIFLLIIFFVNFSIVAAENFPVTSPFGWRIHPITGEYKFHSGVDLGYEYGAGIVALFDGQVIISANLNDGYGNQILLYHQNIDAYTRYAHCSQLFVSAGNFVDAGDIIATVGSTGYSTGPHLHLEFIPNVDGQYIYVDPLTLWN